jgi:hypothetical protein
MRSGLVLKGTLKTPQALLAVAFVESKTTNLA